ncbi:auxin-responsive protein SAUR64-like [Magnolia sinica]|uniref:auxin-responsive protein SAUR64-like n=1 Tax=Magnolia sinica TaxID=86752 RepID=UPI00265B0092|nr:auxin-responsive protein SAUR64-like [Magnolia sinica]
MINTKKLVEMVKKGQKVAALGRRRNSFLRPSNGSPDSSGCSTSVADKGHFVVYTTDGRRFVVPLVYLNSPIFKQLFKMSEDMFGLPCNGPITFPCDAVFVDYILSMIQRSMSEDVEKALLASMTVGHCSISTLPLGGLPDQNMLLHGF